jgi:hypothetical protein
MSSRSFYRASTSAKENRGGPPWEGTLHELARQPRSVTDGEGGSRRDQRRGGSPVLEEPILTIILPVNPLLMAHTLTSTMARRKGRGMEMTLTYHVGAMTSEEGSSHASRDSSSASTTHR